jgi:Tol biopolymer transport system component
LGGTPKLLVRDIDSDVTFSPDGRRIAFARANDPDIGKYRVLTATAEGNDKKMVLSALSMYLPRHLAWSPRTNQLARQIPHPGDDLGGIDLVDLDTGNVHPLVIFNDKMPTALKWSPDGRGIFAIYSTGGPNFARGQIGFLPNTGGKLQSVTRDTNGYTTLTGSADAAFSRPCRRKPTTTFTFFPEQGHRWHKWMLCHP